MSAKTPSTRALASGWSGNLPNPYTRFSYVMRGITKVEPCGGWTWTDYSLLFPDVLRRGKRTPG